MNYIIFDFKTDLKLTNSFLKSASIAHGHDLKTQEWFLWKYRDNPFGESILACAVDGDTIVGCVALGMQKFRYEQKEVPAAISFETFVHPAYQGLGIFKNLISLAEQEAKKINLKFLLNFPNPNSLPGFLKSGWSPLNITEYWIKPRNYIHLFFNLIELKKTFKPAKSNLNQIADDLNILQNQLFCNSRGFSSIYTIEYLKWRFFRFPVSEYIVVDNEEMFAISRIGSRGKLTEVQVLFYYSKNNSLVSLKIFKQQLGKTVKYDLISFPISKNNRLRNILLVNLFIKVPNKTKVTYKVLSKDDNFIFDNLELEAINFHTY